MKIIEKNKHIVAYYEKLEELCGVRRLTEISLREPFKNLLDAIKPKGWQFIAEKTVDGASRIIRPDATLRDENSFPRGYWEAKDPKLDLSAQIDVKIERQYPLKNTIFENTQRAVLYQAGKVVAEFDITQPKELARLLTLFFDYEEVVIANFKTAVVRFREDTPELASGLRGKLEEAHKSNSKFISAHAQFMEMCRTSLNPAITRLAVDEMLIQHLLTERLIRKVFDNPYFTQRNIIGKELQGVIDAFTSKTFNADEYLGKLEYIYRAVEDASKGLDYADKQAFLNTVYEQFFQGYAIKTADTHGIVYTPQPIVEYMCSAVEEALHTEFGLSLADETVYLIDPCTGTGNFMVHLLERIHKTTPDKLEEVYLNRLYANEVMLLPYYVASLNIEHKFYELWGEYHPFEGLCFVDTLDIAQAQQLSLFSEQNAQRVQRQKDAPITVIIGNPPYNIGQLSENDNNKNRAYPVIDGRIKATYAKESQSGNKNKLYDAYVKFFRWASDRLNGRDGIVCYVTNNSFVDAIAFDGMRKQLLEDFTTIYHVDLHGNVRQNPKLSGTTHNVFGIQVGVGITIAIRSTRHEASRLFYHRVPEFWRKEEKLGFLQTALNNPFQSIPFQVLQPNTKNEWIISDTDDEYASFIPLGTKATKRANNGNGNGIYAIFKTFSNGIQTNRDDVMYDFTRRELIPRVEEFIENYNQEVDRYKRTGKNATGRDLDNFVKYDKIKWSSRLKETLQRLVYAEFAEEKVRYSLYRPFTKKYLYFDTILTHRRGLFPQIFPNQQTEVENRVICVPLKGNTKPFHVLMTNIIPDLHLTGDSQCFPFYVYDEDGTNRRENITDWALKQFQTHYNDSSITKWEIFYYTYAVLHHPTYREKFAGVLKRELPRIPKVPSFKAWAKIGQELSYVHLNYEQIDPHPLAMQWRTNKPVSQRVVKMRLEKKPDSADVLVYESLRLAGVPLRALDYQLGGRSALEWVIEQYRVKDDKDPNLYSEDEGYIVGLVGRVVAVSLETLRLIDALGTWEG